MVLLTSHSGRTRRETAFGEALCKDTFFPTLPSSSPIAEARRKNQSLEQFLRQINDLAALAAEGAGQTVNDLYNAPGTFHVASKVVPVQLRDVIEPQPHHFLGICT